MEPQKRDLSCAHIFVIFILHTYCLQVIGYTLLRPDGSSRCPSFVYFTRFADDRKCVKALVIVVLLLETLMTIFTFHGFWVTSTFDEYDGIHISESLIIPRAGTNNWT
ncbi:hypothetical protein BDN67DRAFT_1835 [Paxillus ammoniavirescens]|nr:hypothetical protein BDN67DRAFT_1835 [Paxillus ammoniavirescens]